MNGIAHHLRAAMDRLLDRDRYMECSDCGRRRRDVRFRFEICLYLCDRCYRLIADEADELGRKSPRERFEAVEKQCEAASGSGGAEAPPLVRLGPGGHYVRDLREEDL